MEDNSYSPDSGNKVVSEDEAKNTHMVKFIKEKVLTNLDKPPKDVKLLFHVTRVTAINTILCSFTVIFTVTATWIEEDPQHKFVFNEVKDKDKDKTVPKVWEISNLAWYPQLRFLNLIEEDDFIRNEWISVKPANPNGPKLSPAEWREKYKDSNQNMEVSHSMSKKFVLSEAYELKDFPVDFQSLHIQISSSWDCSDVLLRCDDSCPCVCDPKALDSLEFIMHKPRFIDYKSKDLTDEDLPLLSNSSTSVTGVRYSRAYLALTVVRIPNYYLWNVSVMLLLLGTLSLTTFSIDFDDIGERLSSILTLVLATVAFKLVIANDTPNISYLTVLDIYTLFTVVFICMIGIAFSIMHGFHKNDMDKDLCERVDIWALIVFASIWVVVNMWFCRKVIMLVRSRKEKVRAIDRKNRESKEKAKDLHFKKLKNKEAGDMKKVVSMRYSMLDYNDINDSEDGGVPVEPE